MRKILIWIVELVAFMGFLFVLDQLPLKSLWNSLMDQISEKKVLAADSISKQIIGRWEVESGEIQGDVFAFTSSNRFAWTTTSIRSLFEAKQCTASGTYSVAADERKPTILLKVTTQTDNCFKKEPPRQYLLPIDLIDNDHILLDGNSLTRQN